MTTSEMTAGIYPRRSLTLKGLSSGYCSKSPPGMVLAFLAIICHKMPYFVGSRNPGAGIGQDRRSHPCAKLAHVNVTAFEPHETIKKAKENPKIL